MGTPAFLGGIGDSEKFGGPSEALGDEAFVFLGPVEDLDPPLPRLARSDRWRRSDRDTHNPVFGVARRFGVRRKFEPGCFREQRREVPGAVQADPLAIELPGADGSQIIDAIDVTAGGPYDLGRALTYE